MAGAGGAGAEAEGPIVARGRDAVIIDLGGGRLLRRFPTARDLRGEVAMMEHVRAAGYPVPEVFDVQADGMVIGRVAGPTMLDDLVAKPWRVHQHARTLAELHDRLHRIVAPAGARLTFGAAGAGDVVVHGDLHPGNVLLSPDGPVVIDWTNAGRGQGAADVADAWLLLAAARPDAGRLVQVLAAVLRRRLLKMFLHQVDALAPGDDVRAAAAALLGPLAAVRAGDHNMSPAERAAMAKVARRFGSGAPELPSSA